MQAASISSGSISVRGKLEPARDLAPLTWLRVGGPAEWLFQPADQADLIGFLKALSPDISVTPLGVCSNLIIRDARQGVLGCRVPRWPPRAGRGSDARRPCRAEVCRSGHRRA